MSGLLYVLMCAEHTFCETAGLKQREAQQHGIADTCPNGLDYIRIHRDGLHQYRIHCHADDDEESLEAQCEQGTQIVLPHGAPFPVGHGGHRDRRDGGNQIDFDHAAIYDHENADRENPGDHAYQQRLEPETEQWADIHGLQAGFHVGDHVRQIQAGIAYNDARGVADNMLRHVEHCHDDIPGIGHDQHGGKSLEDPLEEYEGLKIMEAVFVDDHLNQLIGHDERQDNARDGHNDRLRDVFDHIKDAAVPCLGCGTDCAGDFSHFFVHAVEQAVQVAYDAADQHLFEPFGDFIP